MNFTVLKGPHVVATDLDCKGVLDAVAAARNAQRRGDIRIECEGVVHVHNDAGGLEPFDAWLKSFTARFGHGHGPVRS